MATNPEMIDDDQDEIDDIEQDDEPQDEADDTDDDDQDEESGDDDADDEDVVTFGGAEQRGEDEPEHIGDLRRRYRELAKENQTLKQGAAPTQEDIGERPKMDDYWDRDDPEGDFAADLLKWDGRKRQADERTRERERQAEDAQREWEADLGQFETQRSSLKVRDFDASYDRVTGALSETQQAIMIQATTNKAALVYALGKNPDKLADLAKITNPVKFTAAVARLDVETKVARKPSTTPEAAARGSGTPSAGRGDAKMARLEAEADKSGDRTALIAYKRELKNKER